MIPAAVVVILNGAVLASAPPAQLLVRARDGAARTGDHPVH